MTRLTTPAAAARPLLNRVRHILGLKQESDRTCGGMAGLTLLIVLMLSPLCFALLQEGEQSVESGVGSLALTSDSGLQASEVENSPEQDNFTLSANVGTPGTVFTGVPMATGESEPVTSKLYSVENALQLFEVEMLDRYLRQRIVTIAARDHHLYAQSAFTINPTKRDVLLVTGTERVHDEMQKIMAEIDAIVESEEFLNSREMNAAKKPQIKVFKIKHTAAPSLMTIFQSLQIDPQMLLSADMPTNSVLVKATPETLEIVEGLITQLDTEPEQNRLTNRLNPLYQSGGYGYAANPPTQVSIPSGMTPYQTAPGQPAQQQQHLYPSFSEATPQTGSTWQAVPAQPRTSVPAAPAGSALPVIKPEPNVQFMNATPSQARAVPASGASSAMIQQATTSPAEGESPVRAIYRARPETGRSGTGVPSETNPRSATPKTVTITRKVEETTPDGETIEREVTEEVSVEEALVDSLPATAEPL